MEQWRRKKGLMRSGVKYSTRFEPIERELIGDLTATVSEALIARAQSAPKDEFAEMLGVSSGHTEAPQDPRMARLLPDFEREGDEEFDGDNGLLRSLHENDIINPSWPAAANPGRTPASPKASRGFPAQLRRRRCLPRRRGACR